MTALSSSDMTRVLFSMRDLTNFSPFFSVNMKRMKNCFLASKMCKIEKNKEHVISRIIKININFKNK